MSVTDLALFGYHRIHLQTVIVKEDSVSRQSSIYLFRYSWIHLQAAIVKEDSVSHQSSIAQFKYYRWIHLQATVIKEDCVTVSAVNLVWIYSLKTGELVGEIEK